MKFETKRFKTVEAEQSSERQISGLFNIISNNLLVATEVLGTSCDFVAIEELERLSMKARMLANDLNSPDKNISEDEIMARVSTIKQRMLALIIDLSEELTKLLANGNSDKKTVQSILVARRLLRDCRRGLNTIRD